MSFKSAIADLDPVWQPEFNERYAALVAELRRVWQQIPSNGMMHCEGQTGSMMQTNVFRLALGRNKQVMTVEMHLTQMWIIVKEGKAGLYHRILTPTHIRYERIGREETITYWDAEGTFKLVLDGKSITAEGEDILGDPIDEMEAISLVGSALSNLRKLPGDTYEVVSGTDVQTLIQQKLQVRANWLEQQERLTAQAQAGA